MAWIDVSFVVCVIGAALSLYALHVEEAHGKDPTFVSLCDLSEKSSCGHVFSTEYGKIWSSLGLIPKGHLLDQPNALYGFVFYNIIATLTFFKKSVAGAHLALALGIFSVILSAYLGYILAFVIESKDGTKGGHFCILCVSTYVCNFVIFVDSYLKLAKLRRESKARKAEAAGKKIK